MTKSPQKKVPDVGIELGADCMPSELASDRATAPGTYAWDIAYSGCAYTRKFVRMCLCLAGNGFVTGADLRYTRRQSWLNVCPILICSKFQGVLNMRRI